MGTVDPKTSGTVARMMPGGSPASGMADPPHEGTGLHKNIFGCNWLREHTRVFQRK